MCYLDTYQCTVECLNSNLNITSALNGTIESVGVHGSGCHVTACAVAEHMTDLSAADIELVRWAGWVGIGGALIFLGILGLYFVHVHYSQK